MPQHLNIDVLVDAVAKKTRLSRATASKAVEAVLESMQEMRALVDSFADSGSAFVGSDGFAFVIQEQAQTREQQWSAEFSVRLLDAFRNAVEAELNHHRAAGRPPLVIPPVTARRDAG